MKLKLLFVFRFVSQFMVYCDERRLVSRVLDDW